MRTLVVVTRVAVVFGKLPSEEWVRWRVKLLLDFGARSMSLVKARHVWVWQASPKYIPMLEEVAPPGVIVLPQKAVTDDRVPGNRFLVARVDSDDAFLPSALDEAAAMDLDPKTLIDWPDGWQLDLRNGHMSEITYRKRWQSPFLALTQEGRDHMFDRGGPHTKAREGRTVITVSKRSWVQGIHGHNIGNEWRGVTEVRQDQVLPQFGIPALAPA